MKLPFADYAAAAIRAARLPNGDTPLSTSLLANTVIPGLELDEETIPNSPLVVIFQRPDFSFGYRTVR